MIKAVKAYTDSRGNTHPNLKSAQAAEMQLLVESNTSGDKTIAEYLVDNAEKVIDILTTAENSRPAARKVNGGRKQRKPKADAVATEPAAQPELVPPIEPEPNA